MGYIVRYMTDIVNLKVRRSTRDRLHTFGRYRDSLDSILNRLMDHEEERKDG